MRNNLAEKEVWLTLASAEKKLTQNPRDQEAHVLLEQVKEHLVVLQKKSRRQVASAELRLARNLYDEEARRLLVQGQDCLEGLEIAEAILAAFCDDN